MDLLFGCELKESMKKTDEAVAEKSKIPVRDYIGIFRVGSLQACVAGAKRKRI